MNRNLIRRAHLRLTGIFLLPVILEKESNRISKDGFLIIQSDKTRQQLLNQADCLERPEPSADTVERHQKALLRENEKRLQMKRTISMTKAYRQKPTAYDL
ncbi:Peptidyl-tRNA hydrolase ict1, mitochondrial [Sparganum proliferum]